MIKVFCSSKKLRMLLTENKKFNITICNIEIADFFVYSAYEFLSLTAIKKPCICVYDLTEKSLVKQCLKMGATSVIDIDFFSSEALSNLIGNIKGSCDPRKMSVDIFDKIINYMPDLIFVKNAKGEYITCNSAFCDFVGKHKTDIIGQTDFDLFSDESAVFFRENDKKMLKTKKARLNEEWVHYPNGKRVLLETMKTPFYIGENRFGVFGASRDVTKRFLIEQELKRNQDRYKILSELSFEGIIITENNYCTGLNKAIENLFGYVRTELIGKDIRFLFTPESQKIFTKNSQNITEKPYEIKAIKKDKTIIFVEIYHKKDKFNGQKITVSGFKDVTEKVKAQQQITLRDERFKDITSNAYDWIWEINTEGKYIYVSEKVYQTLGYKPEEVLGKTPFDLMLKGEKQKIKKKYDKIYNKKQKIVDLENWNVRKDGKLVCLQTSAVPFYSHDGEFLGYRGVDRDITKQKESEIILQKNQAYLKQIIDLVPNLIFVLDENGDFLLVNKALERFLKQSSSSLIGKNHSTINAIPKGFEKIFNECSYVIKKNVPLSLPEKQVKLLTSQNIFIQTTIIPFTPWHKPIKAALGVCVDITARKKAQEKMEQAIEKATESSKAKTRFLANMSHEIRTPMNGIAGMLELTLKTNLTERQKENLMIIKNSTKSLLQIINDILDISKIESGLLNLEKSKFSFINLLQDIATEFSYQVFSKKLNFVTCIGPEFIGEFIGDANRLRQILVNLIGNAVKFTNKGEIVISTKKLKDSEGMLEHIEIMVKDTGIGIAAEDHTKIFERFQQADDSLTKKFGGTGLGLAITSNLIKIMKGDLKLSSSPGKGSTFSFDIKLKKVFSSNFYTGLLSNKKAVVYSKFKTESLWAGRLLKKMGAKVSVYTTFDKLTICKQNYDLGLIYLSGTEHLAFKQCNPKYGKTIVVLDKLMDKKLFDTEVLELTKPLKTTEIIKFLSEKEKFDFEPIDYEKQKIVLKDIDSLTAKILGSFITNQNYFIVKSTNEEYLLTEPNSILTVVNIDKHDFEPVNSKAKVLGITAKEDNANTEYVDFVIKKPITKSSFLKILQKLN